MRWVFAGLLGVNLVFLIIQLLGSDPAASEQLESMPEGRMPLVMLNEIGEPEIEPELPLEPLSTENETQLASNGQLELLPTGQTPPLTSKPAVPGVPLFPLAPAIDLSKPEAQEEPPPAPSVVAEPEPTNKPEPPVVNEQPLFERCFILGPIKEQKAANQVAQRFRTEGARVKQESKSAKEFFANWIYIPSYPSRQDAAQAAQQLRDGGYTDLYITSYKGKKNVISLGIFRDNKAVERVRDRIKAINANAKVKIAKRYRQKTYHWIEYRIDGTKTIKPAVWQTIVGSRSEAKLQEMGCD